MRIVIKRVVICGADYVLIRDITPVTEREYYATIPYSELNNKGELKRRLNGFEMCAVLVDDCINWKVNPIDEAIKQRKQAITINNFKQTYPNASWNEFVHFVLSLK